MGVEPFTIVVGG